MHLTPEERNLLLGLLEQAFDETRVGVHHATVSTYRDRLKAEEARLRALIEKFRREPAGESQTTLETVGRYMGA